MKRLLLLALALAPILTPTYVQARYNSGPFGRVCDKHMGRWAAEEPLNKQFNFAFNCLQKIHEESGRHHDAYMLWISNIKSSQGNSSEAMNWVWWATHQTKINNELDGRSENDFMAIAFMSMLLHSSHGFKSDRMIEDLPNEVAKTMADLSTAIMKLAGCDSAASKSFYYNPRGTLHAEKFSIDFNIRDTTLSKEEQLSHCAYSSIVNIFANLSINDDFNYISACAKARSAVKLLSKEQYKGLKNSVGNVYTRMTQVLSKGRCKVI